MAFVLADRVKDTTTSTGTGTITLSGTAPTGYVSFGTAIGNGNTTYYTITAGADWEVGIGTYTSAGVTLSRTTVLSSSNAGALVNFPSGTKDVFVTYPAGKAVSLDSTGGITVGNNLLSLSPTGAVTSPTGIADSVGYKGIPQNAKTASYTLALADAGEHISITTGGVIIPANGSVAFPIGSAIAIYNDSASTQTISITTDTLRWAGTTSTGTRTLAAYGLATVIKVASTTWIVSGNVT